MKKLFMFVLLFSTLLYAMDDMSVQADIDNASSMDDLIYRMQKAPKASRQRYIDAIKLRASMINQQKQEQMALELMGQTNENTNRNDALNSLTGGGNRGGGNNGSGGSSGGGGNGGSGNGGGGGHGGGKK